MKSWKSVIYAVAILSVPEQASSWLRCEVLATVEGMRNTQGSSIREVKIRLLRNPYSCEGHSIPNTQSKGSSLWVVPAFVNDELEKIKAGTEIRLKHEVYHGMGPNGLVESNKWSIIEIMQ